MATKTAAEYNVERIKSGEITPDDIVALVKLFQESRDLKPDGKCGPVTLEELRPAKPNGITDEVLDEANFIRAHDTWVGGWLKTASSRPLGIVVHTTDTNPGTAINMAKRRARPFGEGKNDRLASWHVTIETDGSIVQMVRLDMCAWHAGSTTAKKLDFGWANYTTIGIELVSPDDKNFPPAQVEAAKRVWRAIIKAYNIPRDRAMIPHASIDPARRADPGPEWMTVHAPEVLDYAFA
jgi:hypothetical protein